MARTFLIILLSITPSYLAIKLLQSTFLELFCCWKSNNFSDAIFKWANAGSEVKMKAKISNGDDSFTVRTAYKLLNLNFYITFHVTEVSRETYILMYFSHPTSAIISKLSFSK